MGVRWGSRLLFAFSMVVSFSSFAAVQPNPAFTPGKLCSPTDPDFVEFRYPSHVAYCNRNVSTNEKQKVGLEYGVPTSDFSKYEFDHLIPLGIGGSDDISNIWPQPLDQAHSKDKVELEAFTQLSHGKITQAQAIQMIWDWFKLNHAIPKPDPLSLTDVKPISK